jgi:hypothetical protein
MGAPLNPVPQVLRAFFEGFVDGTDTYKWGNVLHFGYTGTAPSNTTCATIAGDMMAAWTSNMASLCPSPTTLQSVNVVDLTSTTSGEGTALGTHPGTRGDDSIPANAAVLVSYPSALRYKGGHPRTYLYILGNADLTGAAEWTPLSEVNTKYQAFLAACASISVSGCNVNSFCSVRYRGKFLPNGGPPHYYLTTPLVNPITISTATARAEMASQRRRIGRSRK